MIIRVYENKETGEMLFLRDEDLLNLTNKDNIKDAIINMEDKFYHIEDRDVTEQYNVKELESYIEKFYENQSHMLFWKITVSRRDEEFNQNQYKEVVDAFLDEIKKNGRATIYLHSHNPEYDNKPSGFIWDFSRSEFPLV